MPSAVFLHTGWRSCGTWVWARFREHPEVRGFYEPLHEDLARLRLRDIAMFRPNSWQSGHSSTAAYFAEYENLLHPSGSGVAGYRRDFAFDDFFMDATAERPALEAYLRGLIQSAQAEGRLPVLKFCRSLGRIAWLQRAFPDAVHITMLRDPGAQWESARQQYELHRNRYFLLAPFVILARNAEHPLVQDAIRALDVARPPRFGRDLRLTVDACWRHVMQLDWNDRYRGFLAFWSAAAIAALGADTLAIDTVALTENAAYRQDFAAEINARTGLTLSLEQDGARPTRIRAATQADASADMALANHAAARFAAARQQRLPAAQAALLLHKLAQAPGLDALMAMPEQQHRAPPRRPRHAAIQFLDTALYVVLLRLSFPLRRLHGRLDRLWLERRTGAAPADPRTLDQP